MADATGDGAEGVAYGSLLTDPALLSVLLISGTGVMGINAVPAALPRIASAFELQGTGVGLLMSASTLPLILLVPVTGILADIYGRRRVVLPSLLLFGLAGVATLGVGSFPTLLGLRVLQGVAIAGMVPLSATLVGDLYTGASGSAAQGIRSSLNGVASAVAPMIAGVLAVAAWQYPFLLYGLAFPAAAVVYRFYPEQVGRAGGEPEGLVETLRSYWDDVRSEANDRTFGILIAGGFAVFFVKRAVKTFVPVFLTAVLGGTVATAGIVLGIYGGVRAVTSPFAGTILARVGRRATLLGGVLLSTAGVAIVPFAADAVQLTAAVALYALGEAVFNPVLNDAVAAFAADEHRGGLMSGVGMLKTVGATVSPVVLGAVITVAGYRTGFLLAAAVVGAYAIGFVVLSRADGAMGV